MLNKWHSTLLFILPIAISSVIHYVYYGQIERMFFAVLKVCGQVSVNHGAIIVIVHGSPFPHSCSQ